MDLGLLYVDNFENPHSSGFNPSNKPLWGLIQSSYEFLMDEDLIRSCKTAERNSDSEIEGSSKFSMSEFYQQWKELNDWLCHVRLRVQRNVSWKAERYAIDLEIYQDMNKRLEKRRDLQSYAESLCQESTRLRDDIDAKVYELQANWQSLESYILQSVEALQQRDTILVDLACDLNELQLWLASLMKEGLLPNECGSAKDYFNLTDKEKYKCLDHLQHREDDIQSKLKAVNAVRRILEQIFKESNSDDENDKRSHDLMDLNERLKCHFYELWLQLLEFKYSIDSDVGERQQNVIRSSSCIRPVDAILPSSLGAESGFASELSPTYLPASNEKSRTVSGSSCDVLPFSDDEYEQIAMASRDVRYQTHPHANDIGTKKSESSISNVDGQPSASNSIFPSSYQIEKNLKAHSYPQIKEADPENGSIGMPRTSSAAKRRWSDTKLGDSSKYLQTNYTHTKYEADISICTIDEKYRAPVSFATGNGSLPDEYLSCNSRFNVASRLLPYHGETDSLMEQHAQLHILKSESLCESSRRLAKRAERILSRSATHLGYDSVCISEHLNADPNGNDMENCTMAANDLDQLWDNYQAPLYRISPEEIGEERLDDSHLQWEADPLDVWYQEDQSADFKLHLTPDYDLHRLLREGNDALQKLTFEAQSWKSEKLAEELSRLKRLLFVSKRQLNNLNCVIDRISQVQAEVEISKQLLQLSQNWRTQLDDLQKLVNCCHLLKDADDNVDDIKLAAEKLQVQIGCTQFESKEHIADHISELRVFESELHSWLNQLSDLHSKVDSADIPPDLLQCRKAYQQNVLLLIQWLASLRERCGTKLFSLLGTQEKLNLLLESLNYAEKVLTTKQSHSNAQAKQANENKFDLNEELIEIKDAVIKEVDIEAALEHGRRILADLTSNLMGDVAVDLERRIELAGSRLNSLRFECTQRHSITSLNPINFHNRSIAHDSRNAAILKLRSSINATCGAALLVLLCGLFFAFLTRDCNGRVNWSIVLKVTQPNGEPF